MALSDVKAKLTEDVPWRTCAVCHGLAQMSEADAAELRGLLADRSVRFKALASAMADDPDLPTIDWQALSRHARAGCSAREHLR